MTIYIVWLINFGTKQLLDIYDAKWKAKTRIELEQGQDKADRIPDDCYSYEIEEREVL